MPAMEPPIFQSPVIIQAITKVSREAVMRQVRVFTIDLFFCSSAIKQDYNKLFRRTSRSTYAALSIHFWAYGCIKIPIDSR